MNRATFYKCVQALKKLCQIASSYDSLPYEVILNSCIIFSVKSKLDHSVMIVAKDLEQKSRQTEV